MSSFRKNLTAIAGLVVLLIATPCLFAQGPAYIFPGDGTPHNSSELYGGRSGWSMQSRNIPAGTVVDPGSQILYIVDTGVNLREEARDESGDSELEDSKWGDPLQVVKPELYSGNDLAPGAIAQNFLTITNTHPTQGVTVHFRYFNDECEDLLDFLVVLTCNDTLIMDPFNFIVPQTTSNTRNRIFGPAAGILTPISSRQFGSGRFLIFATASGTSTDSDDDSEYRFPYEFRSKYGAGVVKYNHCDNLGTNNYFGSVAGISASNLHVFNASAVAFNYLVGSQSWARLVSDPGAAPISQAYGLNAWTRPAVDLFWDQESEELNNDILTGFPGGSELGLEKLAFSPNRRNHRRHPDGDGIPMLAHNTWRILTGFEVVKQSNGVNNVVRNGLSLRAELHGGDTARLGVPDLPRREGATSPAFRDRQGGRTDSLGFGPVPATTGDGIFPDFDSWWGALGTPSIYGVDPEDQVINMLSIMDDYNGSGTSFGGIFANDNSYNIGPAETTYVLQIYDNDEFIYVVSPDPDPNISPFPEQQRVNLKITVDCLRIWVTDVKIPSTSVEDLAIAELQKITTENGGPVGWLTKVVDPIRDASQGWIRFVRDNTQDGTWEAWVPSPGNDADNPPPYIGTFVTIGFQSIVQGGLGAGWWLPAVASDPWVSSTGHPTCGGLCDEGARHVGGQLHTPWSP